MRWPAAVYEWGSTAAERAERLPCDELLEQPDDVLFRAVDVDAPPATLYRWLCQLRHAPYSYDRLDNFGRRSPQTLTPGAEQLQVGQRMVAIFKLAAFEPGRSVTLYSQGSVFGRVAITYEARPRGADASRLLAKLLIVYPRGPLSLPMRVVLPPGDLVMMRRQLLNLKQLAERG
jgi:hypothetical protein